MGLFQSKPQAQPEGETQPKSDALKIIDDIKDVTILKSADTIIYTEKTEPTYTEEFKSEPTYTEEFKSDEKSTVSYTYTEEFESVVNNISEPIIPVEDISPDKEERASEESRTAEEALATVETKKKKKSKRNKKQQKQADDIEIFDLIA